jgi:3-hydroxyisobutyrate dehydrogenase-like beta-hydroxyacid dehydrogenase
VETREGSIMLVVAGLGDLGSGIAAGLKAGGKEVIGVDPSPSARSRWADGEGGRAVADLTDIPWPQVAAVFVVVLTTDQARETLARVSELAAAADCACPVFVVTTLAASTARTLGEYSGLGIRVIEAPISGGHVGAKGRQLSVMLAGDVQPSDVDMLTSTIAARVTQFSEYGQPTVAKLLNNAVMAAQVRIVADVLELARTLNLPIREFFDFLVNSSGSSQAAIKFRKLNAAMLSKDVGLLREAFPGAEAAGEFGAMLAELDRLDERIAAARVLLADEAAPGPADSPGRGAGEA